MVFLAFILAFIEFSIVLLPLFMASILSIIIMGREYDSIPFNDYFILSLVISIVLFYIYLIVDFIFSFSIRSLTKSASLITKDNHYGYLEIYDIFEEVKKLYGINSVKLYIGETEEINAYAVSTFRKKVVILTTGLIETITVNSNTKEEALDALEGIIGHELSHLENWDFLPGYILNTSNFISKKILNIMLVVFNLLSIVPMVGVFFSFIYNISTMGLNSFHRFIIIPLYRLVERYLSRVKEYRCDLHSALTLGWQKIFYGLSHLGVDSYSNIYSSHPNTLSRLLKVYKKSGNRNRYFIFLSKFVSLSTICMIGLFAWILVNSIEIAVIKENIDNVKKEYNIQEIILIQTSSGIVSAGFVDETINISIEVFKELNNLTKVIFDKLVGFSDLKLNKMVYLTIHTIFNLIFIFIVIRVLYWLIDLIIFNIKIKFLKVNTTELTELDFLLYEVAEDNNVRAAYEVLKYGANLDVLTMDNVSPIDYAKSIGANKVAKFYEKFI